MYWGLAYRDLTLQQVRPLEVGRSEGGRDQIRRETGQRRQRTVQRIGGFRGVGGLLPLSRTEVPMRQTVHTQILPQAHQRTRKASGGRARSREQASQSGPFPTHSLTVTVADGDAQAARHPAPPPPALCCNNQKSSFLL